MEVHHECAFHIRTTDGSPRKELWELRAIQVFRSSPIPKKIRHENAAGIVKELDISAKGAGSWTKCPFHQFTVED